MQRDWNADAVAIAGLLAFEHNLYPVLGAEIEYYWWGDPLDPLAVKTALAAGGVGFYDVLQERGTGQWELILKQTGDIPVFLAQLESARRVVEALADAAGAQVSFAAKPADDEPGSGLHIHAHLANRRGENLFFKKNERISEILTFALGGMLETMLETMWLFAPTEDSYRRFNGSKEAPSTVSWGNNNRTTALRLPESQTGQRRIEHRVAGADANPAAVAAAILAAMHWGITHQAECGEPVFGDAFLPRYPQPRLPKTLGEAKTAWEKREKLRDYF